MSALFITITFIDKKEAKTNLLQEKKRNNEMINLLYFIIKQYLPSIKVILINSTTGMVYEKWQSILT